MSKTNPKESQVAPRKWKIAEVEVTQLVETEVNANEMTDEEYQRLVENVRITGGLSSAISAKAMASLSSSMAITAYVLLSRIACVSCLSFMRTKA